MKFTNPNEKPHALRVLQMNIPQELKARPNWALGRYMWTENNEWGKPPSRGAKNNDPITWLTFGEAYALYVDSEQYDFLYFALPLDGSITFTDLDDCLTVKGLSHDAQIIVDALNTYTELSPSGTGLHCINFGSKPGNESKRPKEHKFEMYHGRNGNARFMSVTGHQYEGTPRNINDDQGAIDKTYGLLFAGKAPSEPRSELLNRSERSGERPQNGEIIRKAVAAKDGDKFSRLFFDGDTSEYGGDDSSADMALCSILSFWCGDDAVQIDGVFRESKLYRSKWDESRGATTYGEMTIQRALGGEVYTGASTPLTIVTEDDPEAADRRYANAIEILENGDPVKYILDTFGTLHVGDRSIGEGILLGTAAQSVLNSLGVPSKLTGDSGKGKSDAAKKMMHLHPQEYVVYASLTDKAIWYHPNLRAGSTIFSDDVKVSEELEGIIKRATSNFQRKTERILPVRDKSGNFTGEIQSIPERINWLLTSVRTQGSDELIKRQMGYDVDTSDSQDKAYIDFELQRSLKAIEELPITEDVLICREIIKILKENEDGTPRIIGVNIPFSSRIVWTDTENRRNLNIFMDMVRSFAMIRFTQRKRDEDGNIIATEEDFKIATRHYGERAGLQKHHLDEQQQKFCQHLAKLGCEADTGQMQYAMKITRQTVYTIADSLEKSYWRFSSELRTVKTDDSSNTTNKRFYVLNWDGRESFTLDDYDSVVSLKPEKPIEKFEVEDEDE